MPRKPTPQTSRPKPRHVAAFGAALTTLAAAPAAQGSVITLTFSPASVPFEGTIAAPPVTVKLLDLGATIFSFKFLNNTYSKGLIGSRLEKAGLSNTLFPMGPFGLTTTNGPGLDGTRTIAFVTLANQAGWFRFDFGGLGGDILLLAAAYETTPETPIHIGSTGDAVPEPATGALAGLGLLAIGANEIRRRRKAAASKSNAAG